MLGGNNLSLYTMDKFLPTREEAKVSAEDDKNLKWVIRRVR